MGRLIRANGTSLWMVVVEGVKSLINNILNLEKQSWMIRSILRFQNA